MKADNPHNHVPEAFAPRTIGIIGGRGAMGRMLAREFYADGYRVLVTGEDPSRGSQGRNLQALNRKLVRESDVVVFSVPIPVINGGIPELLGQRQLRGLRSKLFLDVTSTKAEPVRRMAMVGGPTIIGTHPMFGPSVPSLKGQHVFLSPAPASNAVMERRSRKCLDWLEDFWRRRAVEVHRVTPEEHDAFTAHVQFAVLASVTLFGEVLSQSGADLARMQRISTPNSRLLCGLLGRMLREPAVGRVRLADS